MDDNDLRLYFMLFSKVEKLLMDVRESINRQDSQQLLKLLKSRVSPFKGVYDENAEWYMALERQAEAMPNQRAFDGALFVENARLAAGGLRFATLHVTGSNNNLPEGLRHIPPTSAQAPQEFAARETAALAWLADTAALAQRENAAGLVIGLQADLYCFRTEGDGFTALREALLRVAREFAPRPVLILTGDSHYFLDERPEREAPNLRRVMVPGDQDIRAVLASFDPAAPDPFRFTLLGGAADPPRNRCR